MYHFLLYVLRVCAQSNGDLGRRMPTSRQLSRRLSTLLQESASVCTDMFISNLYHYVAWAHLWVASICGRLEPSGTTWGIQEICQPSAWNHNLIFTIS